MGFLGVQGFHVHSFTLFHRVVNRVVRKIRKAQKENEDDSIDWVGRDGRRYGCLLVTVPPRDVGGSLNRPNGSAQGQGGYSLSGLVVPVCPVS